MSFPPSASAIAASAPSPAAHDPPGGADLSNVCERVNALCELFNRQWKRHVALMAGRADNTMDEHSKWFSVLADAIVCELNRCWMQTEKGGKLLIVEKRDPRSTVDHPAPLIREPSKHKQLHADKKVTVFKFNGTPKSIALFKLWCEHPKKQIIKLLSGVQRDGVNPLSLSEIQRNVSSLLVGGQIGVSKAQAMQGPGFSSREELEKDPLFFHLQTVICGGDKVALRYWIRWLATIFQQRKKTGACMVLVGTPGCGKSVFVRRLAEIAGGLYWKVDNFNDMTKASNKISQSILVSFDDMSKMSAAFYNRFKTFVTEDVQQMRALFHDPEMQENFCNAIICANHFTDIPIQISERRLIYFEPHNYAVHLPPAEKEKYALSVKTCDIRPFARFLYEFNLDQDPLEIANPLFTAATLKAKIANFDSFTAWLYDTLKTGVITANFKGQEIDAALWTSPVFIRKGRMCKKMLVYSCYKASFPSSTTRSKPINIFWQELAHLGMGVADRKMIDGQCHHVFYFKDLRTCQKMFDQAYPLPSGCWFPQDEGDNSALLKAEEDAIKKADDPDPIVEDDGLDSLRARINELTVQDDSVVVEESDSFADAEDDEEEQKEAQRPDWNKMLFSDSSSTSSSVSSSRRQSIDDKIQQEVKADDVKWTDSESELVNYPEAEAAKPAPIEAQAKNKKKKKNKQKDKQKSQSGSSSPSVEVVFDSDDEDSN